MSWLKLSLPASEADHEALEAAFEGLGAAAMTLVPLDDAVPWEPAPGETPVAPRNRLEALFDLDEDLAGLAERVRAALPLAAVDALSFEFLGDEDWQARALAAAVRSQFGNRLWLLPKDAPAEDGPTIRLDPGLAFGTGSHPTTRLCLEALAGAPLEAARILDYGCGSGILALAAVQLGAREVWAVDYDPQALVATRDNANYNGVGQGALHVGLPEDLQEQERFDLLVANILANPLAELAPRLQTHLRPGGRLLLAGLLEDQAQQVARAYDQIDFDVRLPGHQQGEWLLLAGTRR